MKKILFHLILYLTKKDVLIILLDKQDYILVVMINLDALVLLVYAEIMDSFQFENFIKILKNMKMQTFLRKLLFHTSSITTKSSIIIRRFKTIISLNIASSTE